MKINQKYQTKSLAELMVIEKLYVRELFEFDQKCRNMLYLTESEKLMRQSMEKRLDAVRKFIKEKTKQV